MRYGRGLRIGKDPREPDGPVAAGPGQDRPGPVGPIRGPGSPVAVTAIAEPDHGLLRELSSKADPRPCPWIPCHEKNVFGFRSLPRKKKESGMSDPDLRMKSGHPFFRATISFTPTSFQTSDRSSFTSTSGRSSGRWSRAVSTWGENFFVPPSPRTAA